ncbi:hypothetical protein ACEE23_01940 [Corynebacterium sp. 32222D000AT]|nr:hypothetical protein [Bacteroidaceae bacterium]
MSLVMTRTDSPDSDYNSAHRAVIDAEFPGLEGRQAPQALVRDEDGDFTHGEKAIELARRFGVTLMPWQQDQVMLALATDQEGRWMHTNVVLLCPRQNGKSLILEVIILYRLFVMHHQIVFSAHQWRTAKSIRNRLWRRIKAKKWASRRLVRNTASAGEAEMETAEGGKLQFSTRSNDMGRGFDQIDLLLLDEAYNLDSGELDAVAPTQLAAEDPQTYYTSSAVNRDKHPKGEELSRIRARALAGESEGMLFSEFCAPDGADRDDPWTWKLANPSYGFPKLVDAKKMRSMRSTLTDNGFDVEMLGWGRWFEFGGDDDEDLVLPRDRFEALSVADPVRVGDVVLAVESVPDGSRVAFACAGRTRRGVHVQLRPGGEAFSVDEAVGVISRFVDEYQPAAVVLDKGAPASVLVEPLQAVGIDPVGATGGQVSAAFRAFRQAVIDGTVTHDESPAWGEQLSVARLRNDNPAYPAINRFAADVSDLIAATLAVWALTKFIAEFQVPYKQVEVEKKNPVGTFPVFSRKKLMGGALVG